MRIVLLTSVFLTEIVRDQKVAVGALDGLVPTFDRSTPVAGAATPSCTPYACDDTSNTACIAHIWQVA